MISKGGKKAKGKKPNQIKEKMDAWLSTRKPMRLWKGGNNLEMLAPERKSRWEKRTNKSGQEQIFIEINKSLLKKNSSKSTVFIEIIKNQPILLTNPQFSL